MKNNIILVPFIFSLVLFSWTFMVMSEQNTTIQVKVGVILDFDSRSAVYWSCMKVALTDFYASNPYYKTKLHLIPMDSNKTVIGAAIAALDLINNQEVQAIIGPITSVEANFVINLGTQAEVPVLTFSASSPSLTSLGSSYFFRLTQNDCIQVRAISGIIKNFGWRQVVPIYVDDSHEEIIPFLIDSLHEVDAQVTYRSVFSKSPTDDQIEKELYKLMTMQTRVFVVHINLNLCSRLFSKANMMRMMTADYVWITTAVISNHVNSLSESDRRSMEGVLGIQTDIPKSRERAKFEEKTVLKFQQDNRSKTKVKLDAYGLQAHDAIFALAMAVEQAAGNIGKAKNLTAAALKISQYGPKIAKALPHIRFTGIAGLFNIVENEIRSSRYKIINMVGGKAKGVASWTPENGMVSTNRGTNFTNSKCIFEPIKWPGGSYSVPKGWEIPTYKEKLRIGVPVGFSTEFVKINKDSKTNTSIVTGFCIDVFKAAVELLPYAISYEFVPYENPDRSMAGTYDDLVKQVFFGKFDAVVGDTTITASRSLYVDFTMPYTTYDVGMVVPIRYSKSKNARIFIKPFTWSLWLTTLCFFIFIAFVVWVLEHRVNNDFRGPPSYQVGTSLWFSFSTMVFTHREKVVSKSARFVIIIWVFVMLILTQSYTANLSSQLTVQQLHPTVKDLNDLRDNDENIGYIKNSYFGEVLIRMNFSATRIKEIESVEDGDKQLTKGTAKGGIAALFVGAPVFQIFLANYCSKYAMVGPIAETNGFAFAFPKRSRLVADMSSAILNLTEGKKITTIETSCLKKENNCLDSSSGTDNSLGLESFWGLFLIAGIASVFSFIISVTTFLYKNKHIIMSPNPRASKWRMACAILETFDNKDVDQYTSRSSGQQSENPIGATEHGFVLNESPTSNLPGSPLSYTNYEDHDSVFGCQQTPGTSGASSQPASTTFTV